MAMFLSVVWVVSWIVIGVFAFLAGKRNKPKYLIVACIAVVVMYTSIVLLGRY